MTASPIATTPIPSARPRDGSSPLRTVLGAPVQARTWKELGYVVAAFVLGTLGTAFIYVGGLFGALFMLTIIGIPLLSLLVLSGRGWATAYRFLVGKLLDTPLPPAQPLRRPTTRLGWLTVGLTDRTSWRALAFLVVQSVLGMALGYIVSIVVAMTVFTAISPVPWVLFKPTNTDADGVERHSLMQFGDVFIDTWPRVLGVAAVGIVGCFALPWLLRLVCLAHKKLARWLLTPTDRERMTHLQQSRRIAVEDSAATLRRVEQDLHDGTQARLVTIAMALGRAEARVASDGDPSDLIAQAHADSKEAIAELRELVRGIHPPALELGLQPALETLTARCSVPVELDVSLPRRPSQAIEAIVYFSVAELLTNVVKHSGAQQAQVSVAPRDAETIAIDVRDDGRGGAPTPDTSLVGSGLTGLAARVGTVDGDIVVHSPSGGPTVVTLTVPIAGPQ